MTTAAGIKTETDILKPFENKLQRAIEDGRPRFELNQPANVTVKLRNGKFSKRPLIGEERFEATSCYQGKRDGMIFVFKPVDPADYAFMEMKASDCREKLSGFDTFLEEVLESNIDEAIAEAKAAAEAMETQAYIKARENVYGETFGSW